MKLGIEIVISVCICLWGFAAPSQTARPGTADTPGGATIEGADKAWKELQKAVQPPMPPPEWQGHPTQEQLKDFRAKQLVLAEEAAHKAKQFYGSYPNHAKAAEARKQEVEMLKVAAQLGSTNNTERLAALEEEQLKDPKLSEDDRFKMRLDSIRRSIFSKQDQGEAAMFAAEEKGARLLIKEFPKREDGYELLVQVAAQSEPNKAREIAKEIAASSASEDTKKAAEGILKRMEALGKPLAIKFAAVDGRQVDLARLKGKVVLVDFWATWCGPCVAELPNVKKAYDELHSKGFEIVGISFDSDQAKLESFVKDQEMPWPQYFDGQVWGNKFGREYGINGIPAMWLVDKKGNLRNMNARGGLEEKVNELLKE